jgi:hypothetical protein
MTLILTWIESLHQTRYGPIVSSFASHVHRIQQVLDAADAHGRKAAFVGRSMVRNMGIARDLGYLTVPPGLLVDMKQLEKLPPDQVCLICTGSQGEPMAALSRMANRDHVIRITEGDTVLLASSLIPGNENAVYRVINDLTRWGANVVHKGNAKVHDSGHASAGELSYVYDLVRPRNVMPVHGEWRHLKANADIAVRTGVHPRGVVIAEDGVTVDLPDGTVRITGKVPAGVGGQGLPAQPAGHPDRHRRLRSALGRDRQDCDHSRVRHRGTCVGDRCDAGSGPPPAGAPGPHGGWSRRAREVVSGTSAQCGGRPRAATRCRPWPPVLPNRRGPLSDLR